MATKSYSFSKFAEKFGTPNVADCKEFKTLCFIDENGNETWVNPGRTGLDLVDFDDSVKNITKSIVENYEDLQILEGNKETQPGVYDGDVVYTLVDATDGERTATFYEIKLK